MRAPSFKRLAAFGAGIAAWEAVVHASLFLNRQSPRLFGIRLAPRLNAVQSIVPAIAALGLARYALARDDRPPFAFRWIARRVLGERLVDVPLDAVLADVDRHYGALVAGVVKAKTSAGRLNLRMAAYLVALSRSLREIGMTDAEAHRALADGLFAVMQRVWWAPDRLAAIVHPRDLAARTRMRQRLGRRVYFRGPDWSMREVHVDGGFGVDVDRCVMRDFLADLGELELCRDVLCAQDLWMAALRGERLLRTATLAEGATHCDFRFVEPASAPLVAL
ncbi:MAG: L-2-amino-thiazoline-4-carboxylic acid hydrolase [Chloroflexota bacterium]